MKTLPIRLRLSLWYFLMFATAAVLLSAVTWWMLVRSVDSTEYHDLQERAQDVGLLLDRQGVNPKPDEQRREFAAIYSVKDDGKWLQIRDQEGEWIYRSPRMIAQNLSLAAPGLLPGGGTIGEFHQGTRQVRTLAYPIEVRGKHYSVQTGLAINKSAALLSAFRMDLLLLTPSVILLAAIGGYWMSRRALHPVSVIAEEARRINERSLDLRLPVSDANDEISDLSQTLNQMLERIDKAFASVKAFTGNASHELRTPISLLRTEIEVALYRPRNAEEYRSTLVHLHEETVRMTGLVEHLLALARADAGAEAMTSRPILVSALFQQMESIWGAAMRRGLLSLQFEQPREDIVLFGDPAFLPRLLSILLENASRYTAPGGRVVLGAAIVDARIQLYVRDTGIGISAEHLPHIFDRFYRAGRVRDAVPKGSGLGLALAKWMAERQGARLIAESVEGEGSCFSFSLQQCFDMSSMIVATPVEA